MTFLSYLADFVFFYNSGSVDCEYNNKPHYIPEIIKIDYTRNIFFIHQTQIIKFYKQTIRNLKNIFMNCTNITFC